MQSMPYEEALAFMLSNSRSRLKESEKGTPLHQHNRLKYHHEMTLANKKPSPKYSCSPKANIVDR